MVQYPCVDTRKFTFFLSFKSAYMRVMKYGDGAISVCRCTEIFLFSVVQISLSICMLWNTEMVQYPFVSGDTRQLPPSLSHQGRSLCLFLISESIPRIELRIGNAMLTTRIPILNIDFEIKNGLRLRARNLWDFLVALLYVKYFKYMNTFNIWCWVGWLQTEFYIRKYAQHCPQLHMIPAAYLAILQSLYVPWLV